jgi:hypothetical protein
MTRRPISAPRQRRSFRGVFQTPIDGGPILRAAWVWAAFARPPLIAACAIFNRRDVTA